MKTEKSSRADPIWTQSVELLSQETECLPVIGSCQVSSILQNLDPTDVEANNQSLDLIILPPVAVENNPVNLHDNYIILKESNTDKPKVSEDVTKKKKENYEDMLYFVCNLCPFLCTKDTKITEHLENAHKNKTIIKLPELKCPACPNIFYYRMSLRSHLIHDHGVGNSDLTQIIQAVIYYSHKAKTKEKEAKLKVQSKQQPDIIKKPLDSNSDSSLETDNFDRGSENHHDNNVNNAVETKNVLQPLDTVAKYFDLKKSRPTHGKQVVCYLGRWAVYRPERGSFAIEHLDPSLCTHIIYSFAGLDVKEDSIRALDPWQDLTEEYGKGGYQKITALRNDYPHLKVSLAIGGWNEGSTNYSKLVADPQRRSKFVGNALTFIRKYKFDGLDLDWEFPGKRGGSKHDKENFLLLVKELKAAFRKHNLLLTAALGAAKDTIDLGYDVEGLSVYLDYIHMMCYDYHGAWDRKTGPNAPLKSADVLSVEYTVNYMLQLGAPPSKLILGIPLYGRTFVLDKAPPPKRKPRLGALASNVGFKGVYTREDGFMGYNEICLELKNASAGWDTYWDEESRTPFAVTGDRVITYDNEQSVAEKIQFAMEKGLGGAMVWSIDTDDFHGDCSEGDDEHFVNFPLMRCINKSIAQSLLDIENAVKHEKDGQGGGSSRIGAGGVGLLVLFLVYFMS